MKFVHALFLSAVLLFGYTANAQTSAYTIKGDAASSSMSLMSAATGKAVIKNCSSIEPISLTDSSVDYYLAVSAKGFNLFHVRTGTTIITEKIKDPSDCYELKNRGRGDRKIIVVYTTVGRKAFLLGPSGILYPKSANTVTDDVDDIPQTDAYLSIGATLPDGSYGEGVIDWDGVELIPAGKHVMEEYDSVHDLFVVRYDKVYGAVGRAGVKGIPMEYTHLNGKDGFFTALNRSDRVGVITPTAIILPFMFSHDQKYGLEGMYKDGVFRLKYEGEPIAIDTSASSIRKVNDYLSNYKTGDYYMKTCTTVYQDRQFADEEVVAHIVNNDTKQITIPSTYIIGLEHVPHLLSGGVGVIKDGKLGMINCETGAIMIPLEYDPVYLKDIAPGQRYLDNAFRLNVIARDRKDITHDPYMIIIKKNGKYGIIDVKGNMLVPFIYEEIAISPDCACDDVIRVKKDGMYGLIDKNTFVEVIPCEYEYMIDCSSAKKFKSDKDTIKLKLPTRD